MLRPSQITVRLPVTAYALWLFKVVQGHRNLQKSKAHGSYKWLIMWISLYVAPFPRYIVAKEVENHTTLVRASQSTGPL